MRRKTVGEIIEGLTDEKINSINTIAIARIEKVDNSKLMCDIQLLDIPEVMGKRDEVPVIEDVPIAPIFWGKSCKVNAPLSKGDKVIVGFCQHETFFARNSNDPIEPEYETKFDINNAIVIGQITADSENSPYGNDFYILYGGNVIRMNSGEVEITAPSIKLNGNTTISGSLDVGKDITTNADLTASGKSFLNHTNGGIPID